MASEESRAKYNLMKLIHRWRQIESRQPDAWQMGLEAGAARLQPFQSLQSAITTKEEQATQGPSYDPLAPSRKRLRERMREQLFKPKFDAAATFPELWRWNLEQQFARMIHYEKIARCLDYFVFYRIVDKKYILYQMNTLLLQQLRTGREWPLEEDELIITPSLNEKYYPYRLEDCFPLFARDLNDESAQLANSLLSVNNGLIVQEKEAFAKVHMVHYIEAQPVRFFYGYDQSVSYKQELGKTLSRLLPVGDQQSWDIMDEIFVAYDEAQQISEDYAYEARIDRDNGHMLQIHVPRSQLTRFVYPCAAYGMPLHLFQTEDGHVDAYPMYGSHRNCTPPTEPLPPGVSHMSLEALLDSPAATCVQSRILGHPNLWLLHGAHTRVFHSNPYFDANKFRERMLSLLAPYIARAKAEGVRIGLGKYVGERELPPPVASEVSDDDDNSN